MLLAFSALWSLPHIEHLVYLLLLEKGDGGIDKEESKYACHSVLHLHSALPVAICVVLDKVGSDKGSRGAVCDGRARVIPVLVRDCCELPWVCVCSK